MARAEEISWTYEPEPRKRKADWFWVLGLITVGGTAGAALLGNYLFALVILLSGIFLGIAASRPPIAVKYGVSSRGVRVEDRLYPFQQLDVYCLEEEGSAMKLRVKSKRFFAPLLSIPVPDDLAEDVERLVAVRLPEEQIEEPFVNRVLEFFGF